MASLMMALMGFAGLLLFNCSSHSSSFSQMFFPYSWLQIFSGWFATYFSDAFLSYVVTGSHKVSFHGGGDLVVAFSFSHPAVCPIPELIKHPNGKP